MRQGLENAEPTSLHPTLRVKPLRWLCAACGLHAQWEAGPQLGGVAGRRGSVAGWCGWWHGVAAWRGVALKQGQDQSRPRASCTSALPCNACTAQVAHPATEEGPCAGVC